MMATVPEQPGEVVATQADALQFAEMATAINGVLHDRSLPQVRFRSPSFEPDRSWSGRRGPDGVRIGVDLRRRNPEAVAADMVEAVLRGIARVDDADLFRALDEATWAVIHPEDDLTR